jgi:alpha-ketoglutarate-dependent taurine dioxygenase
LHNELSYSENWPSKLVFGCCLPPQEGGETPLVDSRQICKHISRDLLEELEAKDVKYIRNLHGGSGLGPSWQDTFETESRAKLESTCNELKIKFEWRSDGGVKLISKRPATRFHPITKEKVWFNQVDQYHPSHFPKEVYETLMLVADGNESELPLNVSFGDDTPITVDIIKEITATVNELMVVRKWNKSDIVIVDNMLIGHGRKSYKGNRKIIVSMAV